MGVRTKEFRKMVKKHSMCVTKQQKDRGKSKNATSKMTQDRECDSSLSGSFMVRYCSSAYILVTFAL